MVKPEKSGCFEAACKLLTSVDIKKRKQAGFLSRISGLLACVISGAPRSRILKRASNIHV